MRTAAEVLFVFGALTVCGLALLAWMVGRVFRTLRGGGYEP